MSRELTRREWIRRAALGAVLLPVAERLVAQRVRSRPADQTQAAQGPQARQAPQPPIKPDSAAADPLYRPDVVQQRRAATASDNDPVVKELEHRLKCTCGCNLDIYTCRTTDFTCTYSPALHKEVVELRGAGRTPDQVVAAFVSKYGEQILMAPPPRGFNLAGYLVPGTLVALAGSLLTVVLLRRSRRMTAVATGAAAGPSAGGPTDDGMTAADRERLRRALNDVLD